MKVSTNTVLKRPVRLTKEPTYFRFEKDFVENGLRCIPMVVRFNLDLAGIKLKLNEWARFTPTEKEYLAQHSCDNAIDTLLYRNYLLELVRNRTGHEASMMQVNEHPAWDKLTTVDRDVYFQAIYFGWEISLSQWQRLTNLQRFALLKLCRPGHENQNFPKAMVEFELTNSRL